MDSSVVFVIDEQQKMFQQNVVFLTKNLSFEIFGKFYRFVLNLARKKKLLFLAILKLRNKNIHWVQIKPI